MVGSRKYSGSSSFLHKFQRSSSGEELHKFLRSSHGEESVSFPPVSEEPVEVAPEAILEVMANGRKMSISELEARFAVKPGELGRAIDSLLAHELAERVAVGEQPILYLTSIGMRAAGYSKIARK